MNKEDDFSKRVEGISGFLDQLAYNLPETTRKQKTLDRIQSYGCC